jgi:hypothetical protein
MRSDERNASENCDQGAFRLVTEPLTAGASNNQPYSNTTQHEDANASMPQVAWNKRRCADAQ